MLILNFLILIVGFLFLIKGADWFVDGSASLAKKLKVSGVIIGLTVVSMGTSAPELAVSSSAALKGANEIAISNVIGSNLFNLLMILGICALIKPIPVDNPIIKRDFPLSIIVTLLLLLFSGFQIITGKVSITKGTSYYTEVGKISRIFGIIFLIAFITYMVFLIVDSKKHPQEEDDIKNEPLWKCFFFIVLGAGLIIAGGQMVVNSATYIAKFFGMSQTFIALTIVAFGTSLPELVTSIVAAKKGENGMAVGNVVGSNIFNILLILGVSSSITPIAVNFASVVDLIILFVVSIISYIFVVRDRKVGRINGTIMIALYVGAVVFATFRK